MTLLDGDVLRKCISSELGFSKEHRDTNIRRIGFVASEIAKHGGISICAAIAPYDAIRKEARAMTRAHGHFLLVYVSTPLSVCERRDVKGLYAKARTGLVECFTGISDDAEIVIDTTTARSRGSANPLPCKPSCPDARTDRRFKYLLRNNYLQGMSP